MPRKKELPKGVRRKGAGYQTYMRINGKLVPPKQWPISTDPYGDEIAEWFKLQRKLYGDASPAEGSFANDVENYLERPAIKRKSGAIASQLRLWIPALGADRSRHSITSDEIATQLDQWLLDGFEKGTVRNRRTVLRSFYRVLDPKRSNPAAATPAPAPKRPEPRDQRIDLMDQAIDAMPDAYKCGKRKGQPHLAKFRARVMLHTGLPPALFSKVVPSDLTPSPEAPEYVRVNARGKGDGVESRVLPLFEKGRQAFAAFHAARAYGGGDLKSVNELNRSFKAGCKAVGFDPRRVRVYDLRHSFLTWVYRETGDLATVGYLAMHSEGSPLTIRYAKAAKLDVALAAVRRIEMRPVGGGKERGQVHKLPAKVARARKSRRNENLRTA